MKNLKSVTLGLKNFVKDSKVTGVLSTFVY